MIQNGHHHGPRTQISRTVLHVWVAQSCKPHHLRAHFFICLAVGRRADVGLGELDTGLTGLHFISNKQVLPGATQYRIQKRAMHRTNTAARASLSTLLLSADKWPLLTDAHEMLQPFSLQSRVKKNEERPERGVLFVP